MMMWICSSLQLRARLCSCSGLPSPRGSNRRRASCCSCSWRLSSFTTLTSSILQAEAEQVKLGCACDPAMKVRNCFRSLANLGDKQKGFCRFQCLACTSASQACRHVWASAALPITVVAQDVSDSLQNLNSSPQAPVANAAKPQQRAGAQQCSLQAKLG